MVNLWPGKSSETGAYFIASVDLTVTIIHLGAAFFILYNPQLFLDSSYSQNGNLKLNEMENDEGTRTLKSIVTINFIFFLIEICLVTLLVSGIINKETDKMYTWVYNRVLLLIFGIFLTVFELYSSPPPPLHLTLILIFLFLALLYRLFSIFLIREFRTDVLFYLHTRYLNFKTLNSSSFSSI